MIINDENKVIYVGNGVTKEWPFSFAITQANDVKVALVNLSGEITELTSNYYVDVVGSKVIYPGYQSGQEPAQNQQPPILPTGCKIIIYRSVNVTQENDLGSIWPFATIEQMHDRTTMILQDLKEQIQRAVKVDMLEDETPTELINRIFTSTKTAEEKAVSATNSAIHATTQAELAKTYADSVNLEGYTAVPKIADIIQKGGAWVDVRAFGAIGDGVHDDTQAIQKAIDSISCSTWVDYCKHNYAGGTVLFSAGTYKITKPIFLNPNVRLLGCGNSVWLTNTTNTEIKQGSTIICDFKDVNQYAIKAVGWVTATGERISNYCTTGAGYDNGSIALLDNVKIEDLNIVTTQNISIGLIGAGSTSIKLNKVSIVGFRYGAVISASWFGSITNSLIRASNVGVALLHACNGFVIRDSYVNKYGDVELTDNNRIVTDGDYLDKFPLNKTGIYCVYSNVLELSNVITEHWDRGYRIFRCDNVNINSAYTEGITYNVFDITQSIFSINQIWALNNELTSTLLYESGACKGSICNVSSINGRKYLKAFDGQGYSSINVENIIMPAQQRLNSLNGITDYKKVYVDSIKGNDNYYGTSDQPVASINTALNLIVDGGVIYLKRGCTYALFTILLNKNVTIKAYGESNDAIPSIEFKGVDGYITGIQLSNSIICFNTCELRIASGSYQISDRSMFKGMSGVNNIVLENCVIKIGSGAALVQSSYLKASKVTMPVTNCTLSGDTAGTGYLGLPVYNNAGKLYIDIFGCNNTVDSTLQSNGFAANSATLGINNL